MTKITKDMIIADVIKSYPISITVMAKYGMHCVGCLIAGMETLEDGAKAHGMTDEKINELVKEINEKLSKTN